MTVDPAAPVVPPVPSVDDSERPVRAVLFDLDGTLVDTIPLIIASFQHAFAAVLGQEVDAATAKAWIGRPLLPVLLEMSPTHGHELDRVYREWNLAHTRELIRPYAGVPDLLDALAAAGIPTAVVTSKRRGTARLALDAVGLQGRIAVATGLEDTDRHKPAPDPLLHGAQVLGVKPEDCLYVGDATVDVLAARAAGMASLAVTWGAGEAAELTATGPHRVVHDLPELTAYLLRRCGFGSIPGSAALGLNGSE